MQVQPGLLLVYLPLHFQAKVDISSPYEGVVHELMFKAGEIVKTGSVMCSIRTAEEAGAPTAAAAAAAPTSEASAAPAAAAAAPAPAGDAGMHLHADLCAGSALNGTRAHPV